MKLRIGLGLSMGALVFYMACVHYTDTNQVAVAWNLASGELWLDEQPGFNVTAPWVIVSRIDIRPIRVCMTSAGRGFNCKLVEFVPEHWREFVQVEGFRYWWWANRISFNWGYKEEYRGMKDLLRGYAYSTKRYPFVKVLRDFEEGE